MSGPWHEQSFIIPISQRSLSPEETGDTEHAGLSSHWWPTYGSHDSVKTPTTPFITTATHAYHYHITHRPENPPFGTHQ